MPKYEAEFEIPLFLHGEDLEHFVDALREYGHPKIIFRVEGDSRSEVINEVANSTSNWWPSFDHEWWQRKLRVLRGKKAQQPI